MLRPVTQPAKIRCVLSERFQPRLVCRPAATTWQERLEQADCRRRGNLLPAIPRRCAGYAAGTTGAVYDDFESRLRSQASALSPVADVRRHSRREFGSGGFALGKSPGSEPNK